MENKENNLGILALIALVIGSQIGGGVFNVASDLAAGANAGAIIIGWIITGIGMIALVFTFQNLTNKRPDLDGGIYSFAKAGFGSYFGFNSAWGYWLSVWLGNVAFLTLLFSAIGYFLPIFNGANLVSVLGASIFLWLLIFFISRGIQTAAIMNIVVTIAKLIPIFLFIVIALFAFHFHTFTLDFWGGTSFNLANVMTQTKSTMLVTLWVFTGVEGAVVLSRRARKKKDVGRATVIGLMSTLTIYILISLLSLGVMTRGELSSLKSPSMAYVLESIVGPWGAMFINLGLIISLLGALLGWTLFSAEIPYLAGKDGTFPKFFTKENKHNVPTNSLIFTGLLIQIFLLTLLISDKPYQFAFSMASSTILVPYLFSALYQVKYSWQHKETKQIIIGIIASIYSFWILYAAGVTYLLLTSILYSLGTLIFLYAAKEKQQKAFKPFELLWACLFILFAIIAIIMLATGKIQI
ncbi:arginine-ornithine antiporter [Neobacillus sp. YIM B02564]|jgi:arginine:ornithine antiporter/lysine permease|uniref:Arginine-ornithine antiporter n=1 Tax=Neobacillus paridis TaxID=2803862 RepID=A0ABS1TUC0_9BACI|nr:arginine-ornithine antiporter [Neobacillus paridis]MBL4954907.1 arginine-ornithine antiporter [Neobacillus paridis]